MNSDYRFTKTNKCIDDEHKKFSSTISEIVSTNQITLELDESNNDSSGCDDEVSDYKISEGNAICDENVERLSINYNTIASRIVMRNERKNVIELIPKIVQQNNVDCKKSLDKSITIKRLCGIEFSEQTINSTANIKKKASNTGGVKKKTMHNIEKSEILSDHNEQSNNDVISDDAICSDVLDLVKFGIVKKTKCDDTIPEDVKIITTPGTDLVIPTEYKCKTCSMSKVFTGNCRDSMVLEVNSDICHNDVVVAALKGFDILSLRGDYKKFATQLNRQKTWSAYLQTWHSNRYFYCERMGYTGVKGVSNFRDGEFAIYEVQLLKSKNYVPVAFTAIYNNFHLICNSSNVQVPTTVCIDSVGAILTNLGTIDLTSQEEILIILRRLYVRMVRIINDSIILLNGQYEIPLIFTYEFAKIQILRTILISNVNFKRRVNLKCIRLKPTEFNIEEIFNNTRDNLFEMIKKNNKGILLYNIKDIKLQIQQNIQIQLKDLRKMLNKKIYNIITSDEININKKMLFEALVLRDDIADCEKHKQNTIKFLK